MGGEEGEQATTKLNTDEEATWVWYTNNARVFVKEFGLMADRIKRTGLEGMDLEIFEDRLNLIHEAIIEALARRAAIDAWKDKPDVAIAAEEG